MRRRFIVQSMVVAAVLLLMPLCQSSYAEEMKSGSPPIGQPLVREGALAVKLAEVLNVGKTDSEVEAESMLGNAGIAPRNGWIMDYPVTPDVAGELRSSIAKAVDAKKISVSADDALKAFDGAMADSSLMARPYTGTQKPDSANETKPEETVINNYYDNQGPPVVTYYPPPPDYAYYYSWVPYPFWWGDFWFGGFFILRDFHKVVIINKRVVVFTNHFTHIRNHRVLRIDPVHRFNGRTFRGIGAPRTRTFISTGVSRSDRRIFNSSHDHFAPRGGTVEHSGDGIGGMTRPSREGMHPSGGGTRPSGGKRNR
jgi:hypothetical protein